MVSFSSLWIPILVSAVLCFIMSSLIHIVFKWHKKDNEALPKESELLQHMRDAGVGPGSYAFPFPAEGQSWNDPDMAQKFAQGPAGFMRILPLGPVNMGKSLLQWFVYLVLVGMAVAYVMSRGYAPGGEYWHIFIPAMVASGIAHVVAQIVPSIWMAQPWRVTAINMFDGVLYALLTGGSFAGLWPS